MTNVCSLYNPNIMDTLRHILSDIKVIVLTVQFPQSYLKKLFVGITV